jgi:hypothetical protein
MSLPLPEVSLGDYVMAINNWIIQMHRHIINDSCFVSVKTTK